MDAGYCFESRAYRICRWVGHRSERRRKTKEDFWVLPLSDLIVPSFIEMQKPWERVCLGVGLGGFKSLGQ